MGIILSFVPGVCTLRVDAAREGALQVIEVIVFDRPVETACWSGG
jgi:hypothetical protein